MKDFPEGSIIFTNFSDIDSYLVNLGLFSLGTNESANSYNILVIPKDIIGIRKRTPEKYQFNHIAHNVLLPAWELERIVKNSVKCKIVPE